MTDSGDKKLAGVIGWPVGHSLSPRLHGYWLAEYGIDGEYRALAVKPEELETTLRGLCERGFKGVNVTVPHKEAAARIVDHLDAAAARIGAVNTIVVDADGTLSGSNTDGFGFMENLKAGAPSWRAAEGKAVILGAGGAGRAVAAALVDAGVPDIAVVNRTRSRADALIRDIGGPIAFVPWRDRAVALDGARLLINTTSLGMKGAPPLALDLNALPPDAIVTDIVYVPLLTPLLHAAAARGNRTVDGLGMLLHQARPGFRLWFGVDPKVTPALRAHVMEGLAA